MNIPSDESKNVLDVDKLSNIILTAYEDETQLGAIMGLISEELSEPYSIYTYRYFVYNWPKLTILAHHVDTNSIIGVIICKIDTDKNSFSRGYIAMLAVSPNWRRMGLATRMVQAAINAMILENCDEILLETETMNKRALNLYSKLGFIRERRMYRYYLSGTDAYRLKLLVDKPKNDQ